MGLPWQGGYAIGGIFLAACQAQPLVWLLNGLLVGYLSVAGKGALVLANFWLSLLLVQLTLTSPWPRSLRHWISLSSPQLWSLTLLALWGIALALVFLLSLAAEFLRRQGWNSWQRLGSLGSLTLVAMGFGRCLFRQWLMP